jgi:hypothetical protein
VNAAKNLDLGRALPRGRTRKAQIVFEVMEVAVKIFYVELRISINLALFLSYEKCK